MTEYVQLEQSQRDGMLLALVLPSVCDMGGFADLDRYSLVACWIGAS